MNFLNRNFNDNNEKCIRQSTGLARVTCTCFTINSDPKEKIIRFKHLLMCYLPSSEVGVISFSKLRPFGNRTAVVPAGGRLVLYLTVVSFLEPIACFT